MMLPSYFAPGARDRLGVLGLGFVLSLAPLLYLPTLEGSRVLAGTCTTPTDTDAHGVGSSSRLRVPGTLANGSRIWPPHYHPRAFIEPRGEPSGSCHAVPGRWL